MDECEYEVRISDPGEVAAALPQLLGFRPEESVVVIGLGGESGGRVGMTIRADIPPPRHAVPLAGALARDIATDDPAAVLLAVVSEAPDAPPLPGGDDDLPHRDLVHALVVTLAGHDIPVRDALLVRRGRWWSYDCPHPCCAPGTGTPLPGGVSALEAASVATGQVVAQSRAELEARLLDLDQLDRERAGDAVLTMASARFARAREGGWASVEDEAWSAIQAAVEQRGAAAAAARLSAEELARIVWGLRHGRVRDRAFGLTLADPAAAERLWTECTRRAPMPLDAVPATLVAVCAWLRGDGAMASVALEHALDSDEDYEFARTLRRALARCVRPAELRAALLTAVGAAGDACSAG